MVSSLEMLSGRGKKEYAKEAQAAADESATPGNDASDEPLEAVLAKGYGCAGSLASGAPSAARA